MGERQDGRTELEALQMQINQIADDSLQSTREMVNMTGEAEESGIKTMQMLDEQGEVLTRVSTTMKDINEEMKAAEKNIEGMEKCCGLCVCPWNKSRKVRDKKKMWKAPSSSSNSSVSGQGQKQKEKEIVTSEPIPAGEGQYYIQRITNDAREDEMEENMQIVAGRVNAMKEMAVDMNVELEKQNNQLDKLNEQGSHVDMRITKANKRTERLL